MPTLTAYHGARSGPFDRFDPAKQSDWKFGFWFASSRDFAEIFAIGEEQPGAVAECRITLRRPYTIATDRWNSIRDKHHDDGAWFAAWRLQLQEQGYDGLKVKGETFNSSRGLTFLTPDIFAVFSDKAIEILAWRRPGAEADMELDEGADADAGEEDSPSP